MKTTRLICPALIAATLVMGSSAFAEPAADIIINWANKMSGVVDDRKDQAQRERLMTDLTKDAKEHLSKVSCKTEDDAKRTYNVVSSWRKDRKLPIGYSYQATCDAKTHLLNVDFSITQFIKDTAQDAKDDAANVGKLTNTIATWGDSMRKAVDLYHEQQKLKIQIDSITESTRLRLADVPCRHTSDASLADMVASEVSRKSLQIDYSVSGQCDAQKWHVEFKVTKFTVQFDPKKDDSDVGFSSKVQAEQIVDDFFKDAKTFIDPQALGEKLILQYREFPKKVGNYTDRLKRMKCADNATDKTAGFVQDMITTKANAAREYISISSVRVLCSSGHLDVSMTAEPVKPNLPPTFPANARSH